MTFRGEHLSRNWIIFHAYKLNKIPFYSHVYLLDSGSPWFYRGLQLVRCQAVQNVCSNFGAGGGRASWAPLDPLLNIATIQYVCHVNCAICLPAFMLRLNLSWDHPGSPTFGENHIQYLRYWSLKLYPFITSKIGNIYVKDQMKSCKK